MPLDPLARPHPAQRLAELGSSGSGSLSSGRGSTAPLAISSTAGAKLRRIAIEPVTVISSL